MIQIIEANVQQNLVTLLVLGCTIGVVYIATVLAPKSKQWVNTHMSATAAKKVDAAIDGLTRIAEGVVQHFNQTIVNDASGWYVYTRRGEECFERCRGSC